MKQQALVHFPWPWLSALALLIFFCFFVALIWRITRQSVQPMYSSAANLPLEEGEIHE